ncbi:serine hydrolase domain-containing protein [Hyphococcus sp.]|uniref:serine hydrolase domain-containing protein n=1 Tax=Hyphococcus sp. TaxID=2038636 RepID=UPI003750BE46
MRITRTAIAAALAFGIQACAPGPAAPPETETPSASACAAPVERIDPALAAKIDVIVDDAALRGFAGGVALMRDGIVIYDRTAGSASLDTDIPVTSATLFHVASITKYFTAGLILKAAEEGKLSVSDSVGVLAPGTKLAARGVTIKQLLMHESGLGSSYAAEAAFDRDAAIAAIDGAPVDLERVGQFRYSSDGYDLLGVFVEKAFGVSYEQALQEKLFAPACLEHASHWGVVDVADPQIVSQPLRALEETIRRRNYGMTGSAGLLISAKELVQYQNALAQGAVLAPSFVNELFAPRGEMSLGRAIYGAFLSEREPAGRVLNARGYEDWGDNAILNHYLDHDIIVAVVTSRGPSEDSGESAFRNEISEAVEAILFGGP